MGEAARLLAKRRSRDASHARSLERRFLDRLRCVERVVVNGDRAHCVPGIVNPRFACVESESLMTALPDLAFSTGSACTSARIEPSHVLRAIGLDDEAAHGSLRFSFGRFTTAGEVDYAARRVWRGGRRAARAFPGLARGLPWIRFPGRGQPGRSARVNAPAPRPSVVPVGTGTHRIGTSWR